LVAAVLAVLLVAIILELMVQTLFSLPLLLMAAELVRHLHHQLLETVALVAVEMEEGQHRQLVAQETLLPQLHLKETMVEMVGLEHLIMVAVAVAVLVEQEQMLQVLQVEMAALELPQVLLEVQ
jgi:hypothetical protein